MRRSAARRVVGAVTVPVGHCVRRTNRPGGRLRQGDRFHRSGKVGCVSACHARANIARGGPSARTPASRATASAAATMPHARPVSSNAPPHSGTATATATSATGARRRQGTGRRTSATPTVYTPSTRASRTLRTPGPRNRRGATSSVSPLAADAGGGLTYGCVGARPARSLSRRRVRPARPGW